jgi:hypothetical protein
MFIESNTHTQLEIIGVDSEARQLQVGTNWKLYVLQGFGFLLAAEAAARRGRKQIAVGFRGADHGASSVPITAEGPGAILFWVIWIRPTSFSARRRRYRRILLRWINPWRKSTHYKPLTGERAKEGLGERG